MASIQGLNVDESLSTVELDPVSRLDLIKYAGASGDFNPIHTIDKEAEKAGLPGIIAHGMFTMGNLSKLFTPFVEEGFVQKYLVRFGNMVFLGDVVTLHAQLKEKNENRLVFEVEATNQAGKNVAKGKVHFQPY